MLNRQFGLHSLFHWLYTTFFLPWCGGKILLVVLLCDTICFMFANVVKWVCFAPQITVRQFDHKI